jgi:prevent-host-death family protein
MIKRSDAMEALSVSKFKATCLAVLEDVKRQKKKVVITKRGIPIAEIVPIDLQQSDVPLKDTVLFMGDIVSPVAEDDWEVFK